METLLPEKLPDEKSPVRFVKIWLERKLNDWTWQLTKTKHIVLINNKTSIENTKGPPNQLINPFGDITTPFRE